MKKFWVALLSLAMLLSLCAGCGADETDESTAEGADDADTFTVGFSVASLEYP